MEGNWNVLYGDRTVGKCNVIRCGLYYQFCCRSEIVSRRISRLFLNCGAEKVMMGVLVPTGDCFVLEKRLPVKSLPAAPPEFYIETEGQAQMADKAFFIPVNDNDPFPHLSRLRDARFACHDGIVGLTIQ